MANIIAIVVAYNRPRELALVLSALRQQVHPPDKCLVIDNASSSPVNERHKEDDWLRIIRMQRNVGGAGGYARGIAEAIKCGADWIWLLDDDGVPDRNSLSELLVATEDIDPHTAVICSTVMEFGAIGKYHRRYWNSLFCTESVVPDNIYQQNIVNIDLASFVGFMIHASAVNIVGLPREDFFLAYDDTEYSLRLRCSGYKICLATKSHVSHLRPKETRLSKVQFGLKHYYNVRNRIVVYKAYGKIPALASFLAVIKGLIIWGITPARHHPESLHLFFKAIRHGLSGRLGPF